MNDEFTSRRLVRDRDAASFAAARAALNTRAAELRPQRDAIVELLHAVAVVMEHKHGKRTNDVALVYGVSTALGMSDKQSWAILLKVLQEASETNDDKDD